MSTTALVTLLQTALFLIKLAQGPNVPQALHDQAITTANKAIAAATQYLAQTPVPSFASTAPVLQSPVITDGGDGGGEVVTTPVTTQTLTPTASCTPLPAKTQTLACPSGQTGSITQSRASSCAYGATSPVWSDWSTVSNTCSTPKPTPIIGAIDPVTWMNTTKPGGSVHGFFETWDAAKQTWVSGTSGVGQPFRMSADASANKIYWRKDMPADTQRSDEKNYEFVGEIYTFDAQSVRLRFETFPFFPCPSIGFRCDQSGIPWDIRPDKFRLFTSSSTPLDSSAGLFFVSRPTWHSWSRGPYPLKTYYCNSYAEFHAGTCTIYQDGGDWAWVTVEAYQHYDIFNADGDRIVATPDGTPQDRLYDVLIVSEEQQVTDLSPSVPNGKARGAARERFFYGRIGNDYYGLVRWDEGHAVNDTYVLTARTVAYGWDTSYSPQFSEMRVRGMEDRH